MGHTSFLTGGPTSPPQSLAEAVYELANCSDAFVSCWQRVPRDKARAGRVSEQAMTQLDHIVNEVLRARDALKSRSAYVSSTLKTQLDLLGGLMAAPVTRAQQNAMITAGPGNGALPAAGASISLEKLLNKIKHRHHATGNFRVALGNRHIFVVNVDKPDQTPDSVVEFDVLGFCEQCTSVAALLNGAGAP